MEFYFDPKDEAYGHLIDIAISKSEYFVLRGSTYQHKTTTNYDNVMSLLEPFLVKKFEYDTEYRQHDNEEAIIYEGGNFYTSGVYYFYRCSEESGKVLKQVATRLADWLLPNMPEDLCFFVKNNKSFLFSIVHEHMYSISLTEDEAIILMEKIPGIFLRIDEHQNIDMLLDDAIQHRAEKLMINNLSLTQLPAKIRYLTELRYLTIHEEELYELPEQLFELEQLETLDIYSANLREIPKSIGKLKHLKKLNIHCGILHKLSDGLYTSTKNEISLHELPIEISELSNLEQLTLHNTNIRELPIELTKLTKLKVLDISHSSITHKPAFLKQMKQLKYCHIT